MGITVFGDRAAFAIEIGEPVSVGLRVVDMWAAGERLTADDNVAYVPSLGHYLQAAAAQVDQRQIRPIPFPGRSPEEIFRLLEADETDLRERYWFLRWSETLDNVSSYAYLDDDLVIVFALWRAQSVPKEFVKVFVARIAPEQFVAVLREAAALLVAQ